MGYNAIDLIDKAINIATRKRTIYETIEKKSCNVPTLNVMSKVLIKEVDRLIEYYKSLKEELKDKEIEEIDFGIYDKMAFLINEFTKRVYEPEINNVREYLIFSIELEEDIKSLFIDLQGRYVKNERDTKTRTYKIFADIIEHKTKYIEMLKKAIK